MTVYLLRHAKAYSRAIWIEDDRLRPLTAFGDMQSRSIATALVSEHPLRLISSPAVRCAQTLDPLSRQMPLRIELEPRLEEGADPVAAAGVVLEELDQGPSVLCSHGDVIPAVLRRLRPRGLGDGPIDCKKGSFWRLERDRDGELRATYWHPRPSPDPGAQRYGGRDTQRLAVLDMGSSSFHLLVADIEPGGALHRVGRERVMLRLGATIVDGAKIPAAEVQRALETVRQLRADAEQAGASRLLPVATAALREAGNSAKFVARLSDVLGTPVRVLSGPEEARLIFRALQQRLGLHGERALGIDLGGGSLELALGQGEKVAWENSLPLGTVRLHHALVGRLRMKRSDAASLRELVAAELKPCAPVVRDYGPSAGVLIGGTGRALYRLLNGLSEPYGRIPIDARIEREELRELSEFLVGTDLDQRLSMPGMSARRADVMPAGAIIVRQLLESLDLDSVAVCDWGVREGALLDEIRRGEARPD